MISEKQQLSTTATMSTSQTGQQQHPQEEHLIHHDTNIQFSPSEQLVQKEPKSQHQQPSSDDQIKRVVCMALDQSGYSEYAFNWAVDNYFRKNEDLVILLNVRPIASVPGPFVHPNMVLGTTYMDFTDYLTVMEEQNRKESHALLHYYASILKRKGFTFKAIALRGDPRDEIVRKVKEVNCDSIVLGSRGLGMVKRALLGSLSDYCIHHVECPVVVVRHPKPDTVPQYGKYYLETHKISGSGGATTSTGHPAATAATNVGT